MSNTPPTEASDVTALAHHFMDVYELRRDDDENALTSMVKAIAAALGMDAEQVADITLADIERREAEEAGETVDAEPTDGATVEAGDVYIRTYLAGKAAGLSTEDADREAMAAARVVDHHYRQG